MRCTQQQHLLTLTAVLSSCSRPCTRLLTAKAWTYVLCHCQADSVQADELCQGTWHAAYLHGVQSLLQLFAVCRAGSSGLGCSALRAQSSHFMAVLQLALLQGCRSILQLLVQP